jgi:hypothetical protein
MKRVVLTIVLLLTLTMSIGVLGTQAATDAEIEQAIVDGLIWLAAQQNLDGSWAEGPWSTAETCFALTKLQERAYELGYPDPFDPAYEYSDEVALGWDYVFTDTRTLKQTPLPLQDHTLGASGTLDDPDTNGNGYGVYFPGELNPSYTTGVCLMALEASGTPNRPNDGGLDFNNDMNPDTFLEIAQEVVDWLAYAQADVGQWEGGWHYTAKDNVCDRADQSISGFVTLGLLFGEQFGATVPGWVKTELNAWITYIQCTTPGADYGGAGYTVPCDWVNEYKTGHLITQMTFVGDVPGTVRFQDALAYIENTWQSATDDPGWGYNVSPASYIGTFSLMKGLVYSGIDLIDTEGGGGPRDDDWFNQEPPRVPAEDFASVLVGQQNPDGSWPICTFGNENLCTVWALLTLEKIAPEPPPTPEPIGGITFPVSTVELLVPWVGLAALVGLAVAAVAFKKSKA